MSTTLLLSELYRGNHPIMVRLRAQLADIAQTPGLVTVLIEGPPGTGKTTMARALAMARVLSVVDIECHRITVDRAVREVREGAALKWYRDISLAGLTDTLADAQLFGIGERVASSVTARIGIFEQAMTGCLDSRTTKPHQELVADAKRNDPIPLATGGTVLLDEIGDLAPALQAKLLRVLNGEMQFRVGTEGDPRFGFLFRGLVILATWRDIDGQCDLREDLRQRILQHRVRVPSLSEYPRDVRLQMVISAAEVVKKELRDELAHLDVLVADGTNNDTPVLAADWLDHVNRAATSKLPASILSKLADANWSAYGQLRGLRATLRRVLRGGDVDVAMAESRAAFSRPVRTQSADTSIDRLRRYLVEGCSLSDSWMNDRHCWAAEMLERLDRDDPTILAVLSEADYRPGDLRKELRNLMRSGSKASGN